MTSLSSPSAYPQPFGALLRRFRLAAGLSQEALAERARMSARAVSDLERGVNRAPRHETLLLLIEALNLGAVERQLFTLSARPELAVSVDTSDASSARLRARLPHLPQPPTSIIGREDDIQRGIDLLIGQANQVRLVTLVGPGGVGKTRLAVEMAHRSADAWSDGAAFVALAELQDVELVATELALRLGVQPLPRCDVAELLCNALASQRMLLVLDNFERVITAASLVSRLLERCADLHILTTSRVPLRIRAETVMRIDPLSPVAALDLLTERAAAAGATTPIERATAIQICRLGDHLPLAIELVAMRLPTQTPALLLDRLSTNLTAFKADVRDLPPRQRALSATIDWSYQLLTTTEQSLFRCLGVFEGGCRLRDVAAVWDSGQTSDATLSVLSALVEHSLVQVEACVDAEDSEPRYRMLDTIHAFAQLQLRECGEWDEQGRAHADHFAELAATAAEIRPGQDSRDAVVWRELPNLRAARAWAHEHGATHTELVLITGLGQLLYMHGLTTEALSWTYGALALGPTAITADADAQLWAWACYGAARVLFDAGDLARAEHYCEEGIQMERSRGLNAATAELLCVAGQVAQQRGEEVAAGTRFAEALAHARATGNPQSMGTALTGAAQIALRMGAFDEANAYLREALALSTQLGLTWAVALIQTHLGQLALARRDFTASREHFRTALTEYQQVENELYLAWCLEGLAAAELGLGMAARAARLCGAAETLRERAYGPRPADEQSAFDRTTVAARASLGEVEFYAAWAASRSASRESVITFALATDTARDAPAVG